MGKRLVYVHMGFESVYEQDRRIAIDKGGVVSTRTIDNRGKEYATREGVARAFLEGRSTHPEDDGP